MNKSWEGFMDRRLLVFTRWFLTGQRFGASPVRAIMLASSGGFVRVISSGVGTPQPESTIGSGISSFSVLKTPPGLVQQPLTRSAVGSPSGGVIAGNPHGSPGDGAAP